MRSTVIKLTGWLLGLWSITAVSAVLPLTEHTALYHVRFKGIGAGDFELRLSRSPGTDSYRYETIPHPSLLARLIISADSREVSEFEVTEHGVKPHSYHLNDGGSHKDDIQLNYDWAQGRVSGHAASKPVNLGLLAGTQDVMSIRAAILYDLTAGKTTASYPMIDQDEQHTFIYRQIGHEVLATAQGSFDTQVWVSAAQGSNGQDKTWKYWYAPKLGYLPVRAEQLEDGHTRLSFELLKATLINNDSSLR